VQKNHTKKVLVLTQNKNAFYNFFSNPEGIAQLIKGFISNNFKIIIIIICRNEEKGFVFLHDVEKCELNISAFSYIRKKNLRSAQKVRLEKLIGLFFQH